MPPPDPIFGEDLAYVHDAGFGDFARRAAPGILRLLRYAGVADGLVVDLGCGSGIWASALLRAGYEVRGIDQSAAALDIARERAGAAELVHASVLDAELPPCVAVTALGEVLSYVVDGRGGRADVRDLMGRVHAALRPGGILVFDVVGPGREPSAPPRRAWHEGTDWTLCLEASQDHDGGELVRRSTVFRRTESGYRRSDEEHRLWTYPKEAVLDDLAAAGLEGRALAAYVPGVATLHGHDAYAAVKPDSPGM